MSVTDNRFDGNVVPTGQVYVVDPKNISYVTSGEVVKQVELSDRTWRKHWAAYFMARAAKSRRNGVEYPQHMQIWNDKAMTEEECAWVLRSEMSITELFEAVNSDLKK